MKAIRIHAPGGPEVMKLEDVPEPQPKAGEAVVKIDAAGLNFIDVYYRDGRYPAQVPFVPGQEAAGIVTAIGSEVSNIKIGEPVAYSGVQGAYAEYAAVAADRLVVIPSGVAEQQAAAAILQGMTAHYLVNDVYPLKKGETGILRVEPSRR